MLQQESEQKTERYERRLDRRTFERDTQRVGQQKTDRQNGGMKKDRHDNVSDEKR
jgi:hypothetical protein